MSGRVVAPWTGLWLGVVSAFCSAPGLAATQAEAFAKVTVEVREGIAVTDESVSSITVGDGLSQTWARAMVQRGWIGGGQTRMLRARDQQEATVAYYGTVSRRQDRAQVTIYAVTWPD